MAAQKLPVRLSTRFDSETVFQRVVGGALKVDAAFRKILASLVKCRPRVSKRAKIRENN